MKNINSIKVLLFLFFFNNILSTISFSAGSGSFRVELPDAEAMGKGSAFVGEASNPSAVYYNPAGIVQLKGKQHISVGSAILAPMGDYKSTSGDEVQMRRNTFVLLHMYYVNDFGLEKLSFGFGMNSSWGLGTQWADDSFSKYVATKSDLFMSDSMFTTAYQLNDQWSFALSADNDYSRANQKKKLIQPGSYDGDFQLKGKSSGWGYRLATLFKVNDKNQIGLMYRSAIDHKFRGKAYLNDLTSAGSNYNGIFGGRTYETEFSEEFTLPQSIVLGYSLKPTDKWTFNFDLEWMDWSSVKQERINWEAETDATRLSVLNSGNPADRDWKAVLSQAIGAEYKVNDKFRVRGGYYHHQSPIPAANFVSSLPDANSHGITTGFGYDLSENLKLDVAYSALIYEKRSIDNSIGAASGASIDGEYRQVINMILITLGVEF